MDRLIVKGGYRLSGRVQVSGAKNAALPILVATLLTNKPILLKNIPYLRDITSIMQLLGSMGVNLTIHEEHEIEVDTSVVNTCEAPYGLAKTMRASILVLGPLLARFGSAKVPLPGGCAIGSRPVDIHLQAMQKMGACIEMKEGFICASVKGRLKGADLTLQKITVTGTENVIMAAVLAEGVTYIRNAACEPEVKDLACFLNHLGARIQGAGTSCIMVEGVKALKGGSYHVLPDRIEAGTYLIAAALTRGSITVKGIHPDLLISVLALLRKAGAQLNLTEDTITLDMQGNQPLAVSFSTGPYPQFPTDMQAQMMALNILAKGESSITETIFENRFMHVHEMKRLGAIIHVSDKTAVCHGKKSLIGASIKAMDLRASASLVLAALMADGETIIDRACHIDRGYACIEENFRQLGARIRRVSTDADGKIFHNAFSRENKELSHVATG